MPPIVLERRFNSRARKGRDPEGRRHQDPGRVSIHAPARGATEVSRTSMSLRTGFNSRARKGRDNTAIGSKRALVVSIHAPARGATTCFQSDPTRFAGFNSRARKGRDRDGVFTVPAQEGFNSRARKGRDSRLTLNARLPDVSIHAPARGATSADGIRLRLGPFQFTRPQGARHYRYRHIASYLCFNSRARKGRDIAVDAGEVQGDVSIHAPARGATRLQ